jgi:hypothetical protein
MKNKNSFSKTLSPPFTGLGTVYQVVSTKICIIPYLNHISYIAFQSGMVALSMKLLDFGFLKNNVLELSLATNKLFRKIQNFT